MDRSEGNASAPGPVRRASAPAEGDLRAAIAEAAIPVRRFLFGMCCDWERAEDLAQEALLRAWGRRATFDGRADVRTWIFAIARNRWLDGLRRDRSAPRMETMNEATYIPHRGEAPEAGLHREEQARAVRAALGELPAEQREALALRESEGLSFAQIATMLDIPVPTAKSRVRYALLKLADRLAGLRPES